MMEWSHIYSRPDLSGVEVLHAHFLKHRYPKHAHEHAVVGLVESGAVSLGYQGARRQIGVERLTTRAGINPVAVESLEAVLEAHPPRRHEREGGIVNPQAR